MSRLLTREELAAIKVAVRAGDRFGWSDAQVDRRIQDIHSGAYSTRLNVEPALDTPDCFRCGGSCGPHQCMEGRRHAPSQSADWVQA